MKNKLILSVAVLIAVLPLTSSAILITRSYNNSTLDNDDHLQEDASSSQATIGSSSATVDTAGNSSGNMGYRFTGQTSAYKAGYIIQTIDVTATWTVTAEDWEEYSITISPELHAYLNIYDYSTDETDDIAAFSALSSVLRVNGSIVSDTLDGLSGAVRATDGPFTLDNTDSQTLSGYTGNNVFSLQLTTTAFVRAHDGGGLFDNPTGNAVLWGQDGTLDFEQNTSHNGFDEYPSSSDLNADGIFVDADVTLTAIPEPATLSLIGLFGIGVLGARRIFMM